MPMVGSAAEYERLALAALRKADAEGTDATYHNNRAHIYATLAVAAAQDGGPKPRAKKAKGELGAGPKVPEAPPEEASTAS